MSAVDEKPETDQIGSAPPLPIDRRSLNVPNILTLSRFVLALVLFALIDYHGWWRLSAVLFIVAASTDFLDGYYARKYGQVTVLGRVLDPFVDKIIIGGSFIFLLRHPDSGVTPWMAFIIIGREMFVTSLRAILERHGTDFSAKWSGKIKMGLQCVAVPLSLLSLSPEFRDAISVLIAPTLFDTFRDVFLWATVLFTIYSGVEYTFRGFQLLNQAINEKTPDKQIRPS